MTKVVLYTRYSSDNQREESIEAQLDALRNFCMVNDWEIIKEYIDKEVSATSDDRDSFQLMIRESETLEYDHVLVHKLDRFSRNRYDSTMYKKRLKDNGKTLRSALENLDDSPESIILESMLEGMNEYYSKYLGREVRKGMGVNAKKGLHTGGKPPFGYDVVDGRYVINEL